MRAELIADRVHRWTVGGVEIVRVADDDFAIPSDRPVPGWAVPDLAPSEDQVGIAFSVVAIRDGERRIVVDPWLANDFPRAADDAAAHAQRLLDRLAAAGFPAESIDLVVNTHWDGDGWNTIPAGEGERWASPFPNARHTYPSWEVAELDKGTEESSPDGMAALRAANVLDIADAGSQVSDHVRLVPLAGHRTDHVGVEVADGGEVALVPGHLFLSPLQVADPTITSDEDAAVAAATRRAVLADLADRGGLLLTTLMGGPGGGRVVRDGDGFALET